MEGLSVVSLEKAFSKITDYYQAYTVASINDVAMKLVKVKGEFVWHHHENEDELFLVVKGRLEIRFRDQVRTVEQGEFILIPRTVEHCPVASEEVHLILLEPATTVNTGNVSNERTVEPKTFEQ
jgi:mannose-6-phosphate isomerase-like protein (cupin superfamily)